MGWGRGAGWAALLTVASQVWPGPAEVGAPQAVTAAAPDSTADSKVTRPVAFRVPVHARFIAPDAAIVSWETENPGEAIVEYGVGERWDQRAQEPGAKAAHQVTLRGLEPKALYRYRVRWSAPEAGGPVSEAFELDNAINYTVQPISADPSPYPADARGRRYALNARQILSATGVTRGYCLVLDSHEGQLAYELARQSEMIVFGVDPDRARLARTRARLAQAGVYGTRITLHHAESLKDLAFPPSFANLIVADGPVELGTLPASAAQVIPLLQPATGVAFLGPWPAPTQPAVKARLETWLEGMKVPWDWADSEAGRWVRLRRELPPDTGSWTHQYGEAGNTANSREGLQGVTRTDRLQVQWLGRPGADFGIDRNPRMPAPLAVNGRLFHQGLNRIIALDSYNGAVLWSLEIPALRRVNMPRDAGNWCADAERLYIAVKDRCWVVDAASGEVIRTVPLADPSLRSSHEWGYIARAGDLLFGSSVRQGAAYTDFWGGESWYDGTSGQGTEKVCSDDLFAVESASGEPRWRYRGGVVMNPTVAVADGRVLFVECRHPEIAAGATRRIGSPKLWEDQHLVALDARTGERLWEQPIDTADGIVVFYLVAAEDKIWIASSAAGKYHLAAYRGTDGQSLWRATHDWPSDNHGGHMQHPVVVRNTVFLEPCGYEVSTGRLLTKNVGRHEGCATYAATLNALIYRGESRRTAMWDLESGAVTSWYNLRPSCWLSTVPANGMILSPEGGGGCSCGNWLETSLGFMPAPPQANP